jgi:hypothetical protein
MSGIQTRPPPNDLLWAVDGFVVRDEIGLNVPVLLLPETRPSIQLFLKDHYWTRPTAREHAWSKVPAIAIWGPRYEVAYGWSGPNVLVAGIALTAAGCRALRGNPPSHYVNQMTGLPATLEADFMAAVTGHVSIDFITPQLIKILRGHLRAQKTRPEAEIKALSLRQQRRIFQKEWGISPKTHDRFQRLDRLIRSFHRNPWEGPGPTPAELSFSDQSHLIRECVALTGLTPKQIKQGIELTQSAAIRSVAMPMIDLPLTQKET